MISPLSFFKCLAEETRLKTLLLISLKTELCVCDLVCALNLSQPKISRHLADLRKCDIVTDQRRGRWVYYSINPALPNWALEVLRQTLESNPEYTQKELKFLLTSGSCC